MKSFVLFMQFVILFQWLRQRTVRKKRQKFASKYYATTDAHQSRSTDTFLKRRISDNIYAEFTIKLIARRCTLPVQFIQFNFQIQEAESIVRNLESLIYPRISPVFHESRRSLPWSQERDHIQKQTNLAHTSYPIYWIFNLVLNSHLRLRRSRDNSPASI
jgi:hypothetical protein